MTKKVSIIIPVYNGSNYLKEAIDSALAQTYKNLEIIVINDGSTDGGKTEEIAKSYGDKIRYIYQENGGVAAALNKGIQTATGDYISWLSHDDLFIPQKTEIEMQVLEKLKTKETIIFSNFELINSNGKFLAKTDFLHGQSIEEFCQGIYPVSQAAVNGCTTLISKKIFATVGLFDTNLRTSQDFEMWLKIFAKYDSYFIEQPLVKYRIHRKQDTNKNPVYEKESNTIWKKIINSLDKEQIISWGKNPYEIYYELYIRMTNSHFDEAKQLAYKKASECYKDNDPYLSVIVPCYNSSKTLKSTIDTLVNQTYGNFEIILVDDNSTDDTLKIIKELTKTDFRIKYTKNNKEKGVSGSLNTGLELARGTLIARQDSDDLADVNRFSEQVSLLKNNPNIGYCATNINTINEEGKNIKKNTYRKPVGPIEFEAAFTNPIPNATIIYRNDLIKKYNLQFPNKKTGEDYNFLLEYIYKTKSHGEFIDKGLYDYRISNNSLFHANIDEAVKNALKVAKEYYKKIMGNINEKDYNELCHIEGHQIQETSANIKKYYDFSNKCAEYFSWTNDEKFKVVEFLIDYKNNYIVSDTGRKKGIYSAIVYQIRTNGSLGTIKWMICWPFKKIKNRLVNKDEED